MSRIVPPNIAIKPNISCDPRQRDPEAIPYFIQDELPGDLLVEFLRTRDVRVLRDKLTAMQLMEYEQSRFFQSYGQNGIAFDP